MKKIVIFRRFRRNLGVFSASAEGASEKIRVFYRGTKYDVIIFKFQGGAFAPLPSPADAHDCAMLASPNTRLQTETRAWLDLFHG